MVLRWHPPPSTTTTTTTNLPFFKKKRKESYTDTHMHASECAHAKYATRNMHRSITRRYNRQPRFASRSLIVSREFPVPDSSKRVDELVRVYRLWVELAEDLWCSKNFTTGVAIVVEQGRPVWATAAWSRKVLEQHQDSLVKNRQKTKTKKIHV
jgi:hypothetical protein